MPIPDRLHQKPGLNANLYGYKNPMPHMERSHLRYGPFITLSAIMLRIIVSVLCAGCFEEGPGAPAGNQSSPGVSAPPSPSVTSTSAPGPMATPLPGLGYIRRPYGYVAYESTTSQPVSVQDTGQIGIDPSGHQVITGKIKNVGAGRINSLVITINLYNANGEVIGNTYASVDYLAPGAVWKFRSTPFDYPDYQYHQISEIFTG
jgi:hypothetical protein